MYFRNLTEKRILGIGELISNNSLLSEVVQYKVREQNISPLDIFRLISVIDAIQAKWHESLTTSAPKVGNEPFNLHN